MLLKFPFNRTTITWICHNERSTVVNIYDYNSLAIYCKHFLTKILSNFIVLNKYDIKYMYMYVSYSMIDMTA